MMATKQPEMRVASVMLRRGGAQPSKCVIFGDMMELVYVSDSKSDVLPGLWVRVPLSPPTEFAFVMELVDIPD